MTFAPTAEQTAILDAFSAGKNLVVQAGAGTGKTTTLKLLANSTEAYGTYLAFNKSIATEAQQAMPHTVRAMTAHSLAWQEFGKQYADRMNAERQPWGPTIEFLNARSMSFRLPDGERRGLSAYQMTRHAIDTLKAFCQSGDTELSDKHVPLVFGIDKTYTSRRVAGPNHTLLCNRIVPMAQRAWVDVQKTEGVLAYDHSYYLKGWALTEPTIGGQYLMFDECQDANPVLAKVVNAQAHLQRVFVGDSAQQIMAFAGSVDAMAKFSLKPEVVTLTLSESFRFGPAIATAANVLLDELKAPLRLTGTPLVESTFASLDTNGPAADAVLCRTNVGALDEVIRLQAKDRKVCLLGDSKDLKNFVEGARDLQIKGETNYFALMAFDSWTQVEDHVASDQAGGDDLETMVELVNQYGVDVLLGALNTCVHERAADVVVSTAHKAKGREWDAVRISPDFELDPDATADVREAETMLAYVAITRAKKMLDPGLLSDWVKPKTTPAPPMVGTPVVLAAPASTEPTDSAERKVVVPDDTYTRLLAAAALWGGDPDEFAARLLDGALSALVPVTV